MQLYFNYTESVGQQHCVASLLSLSFCFILVQAICYSRGSSLWREADI